jgi:signal transduction histidine kinase
MAVETAALEAAQHRIAALEREIERLREAVYHESCAKDEFLATLSHELRTPLNVMLGWIQLLRVHLETPEERRRALDVLERNLRSQAQVVSDLLDTSRLVTGRMRISCRRVNLDDVVRRSVESLMAAASAKHLDLALELGGVTDGVHGDAMRLQQVIWNLLSNAVRFTPPGGRVRVRTRRDGEDAVIEVSDTGHGIAPDVLPFIFDRFRQADSSLTRRFGGLGLGLSIVRHLVELHGGSVEAASEGQGRGATFVVRLPTREPQHHEPDSARP